MTKGTLLLAAALAGFASAQSGPWQQCGGINHNGSKTCVSGYYCSVINDYYHQCIPGQSTTAVTTTPASTTRATSVPSTTFATSTTSRPATTTAGPTTSVPAGNPGSPVTVSGNIFAGRTQWANPYYASEVSNLAIPTFIAQGKNDLAQRAAKVADVPSFAWMDNRAKVPSLREYLSLMRSQGKTSNYVAPWVVYNLPNRDCAAAASNGELSLGANGAEIYRREYIDEIRKIVLDFPDIPIAFVIEPDSLANMVTNMNVQKCRDSADAYKELTIYAVKQLALPNTALYLDGGHGGWLGWPANLGPAGQLFGQLYQDAGRPAQLRGLAVNVANYNAWTISTCPAYTSPNPNCDEKRYINAMGPELAKNGWSGARFIVDQGRSGKQPTGQIEQGHWCNAMGTGFGARPSTNTGDALADSFVWIKPGGESDGTSDTSAARYDHHCGNSDALKPAPEAGHWFQAYFEQLLVNSSPAF